MTPQHIILFLYVLLVSVCSYEDSFIAITQFNNVFLYIGRETIYMKFPISDYHDELNQKVLLSFPDSDYKANVKVNP